MVAKLTFDTASQMRWDPEYAKLNESAIYDFWYHSIPWERGIIALEKGEAASLGLPESQSWPWDVKQKSIYIVNAHHILHCVVCWF